MAKELLVKTAGSGQKLFNFLKRSVMAENADIHRWIRTGQVRINKKRAEAFAVVNEGDLIRIPPFAQIQPGSCLACTEPSDTEKAAGGNAAHSSKKNDQTNQNCGFAHTRDDFPFPVVYENEELLIIDKPQGIACQGGTGQKENIADILKAYFKNAAFLPAPAHRLDKKTQGLLLIGKSYRCLRFLTECMKGDENTLYEDIKKTPKKIYRAWVYGNITEFASQNPYLCSYLFHNEKEQKEQVYSAHTVKTAQEAKTVLEQCGICKEIASGTAKAFFALSTLKVLQTKKHNGRTVSLAEIGIYTGRKHQIRTQLAHAGFALVGDKKYAPKKLLHENDRFFLQACQITLPENEFTEQTVFIL